MGPVKGGSLSNLLKDIQIPKMFRAEQSFKKDRIEPEQIPGVVREQLSRPEISSRIQPGMNIAITAGSRGIANVNVITRAIVDYVKEKGAYPFIVPAMGSHGGAKAERPERASCRLRNYRGGNGMPDQIFHGNGASGIF